MRRQNTARVLQALRQDGPATRAELAKATGLAKATVGVIVPDLLASGALEEEQARPGSRGRPGRPVRLSDRSHLAIGLELNVDYVSAVVLDLAGRVQLSRIRPVEGSGDSSAAAVLALATEIEQELPDASHVLVGATVAVPGLVRSDDRTVAWAPNLRLDGIDLAGSVEEALGGRCSVRVGNDANCAALAEAHHGAATDVSHALYLTGTVGIGAGIIDDGEVLQGAGGFAGEVGHLPFGEPAALCGCGRHGCWEASIGLHAMLALVGLPELETPLRSAEQVAERAASDPQVRAALEVLGHRVGVGLAALAQVLDPSVVVLGGYFVPLGEWLLPPVLAVLDDELVSRGQVPPEVRLSSLGISAAATGAAELALQDVFTGAVDLG